MSSLEHSQALPLLACLQRRPAVSVFTIDEVFGSWQQVQTVHFRDGGIFDQLYQPNR